MDNNFYLVEVPINQYSNILFKENNKYKQFMIH